MRIAVSMISMISISWALFSAGCIHYFHPNAGHGDVRDVLFRRRHPEPLKTHPHHDGMLAFARELTVLEDDIRRDGSITVKSPDVWGDGNLVQAIQENDVELKAKLSSFTETLQAYIARSDQGELHSTTALAQGLSNTPAPTNVTATVNTTSSPGLFELLKNLPTFAAPAKSGVGLEPTELERQHLTYLQVVQSLRRRNMGDDNSRAAGYGLYLFRVPVSILPGRETSEGHAAVVTLRTQLEVDEAHLKYTLPKLAIADLVDALEPYLLAIWDIPTKSDVKRTSDKISQLFAVITNDGDTANLQGSQKVLAEGLDADDASRVRVAANAITLEVEHLAAQAEKIKTPDRAALMEMKNDFEAKIEALMSGGFVGTTLPTGIVRPKPESSPLPVIASGQLFGIDEVTAVKEIVKEHFKLTDVIPKPEDLRAFLFGYYAQIHITLERQEAYDIYDDAVAEGRPCIVAAAQATERGEDDSRSRNHWRSQLEMRNLDSNRKLHLVGWPLAKQMGLLDLNLKRILKEMRLKGKLPAEDESIAQSVYFFRELDRPTTLPLWQAIIREEFPVHVFTIDPQVEEQNVYDAFSRRREMQLALAYGVAQGTFNAQQRINLSRRLALDTAAIDLNRTVVGFSHGDDTFGWYFHPRVQSPPTESTNIGALARTIWSTGPTEHYDMKHRKLEPGMRECEVLIAMPSFVTQVSFDVTTNWEKTARPGVTKRSYEEMVAQGGRLHQLRMCLQDAGNQECYRPGDYARLLSRVDQLEHMLGMQTHLVNVPYEYEQSGSDLFDTGKTHLKPVISGYYGLQYLKSDADLTAHVFITGKNFHPTQTHVIVGGAESHSLAPSAKVEVINRQLIHVEVGKLPAQFSADNGFEVRVGTPAGMSNTFTILATPKAPDPPKNPDPPKKLSDFDWSAPAKYEGKFGFVEDPQSPLKLAPQLQLVADPNDKWFVRSNQNALPAPKSGDNGRIAIALEAKFNDGKSRSIGVTDEIPITFDGGKYRVKSGDLEEAIRAVIANPDPRQGLELIDDREVAVAGVTYLKFDAWPYVKLDTPITIILKPLESKMP